VILRPPLSPEWRCALRHESSKSADQGSCNRSHQFRNERVSGVLQKPEAQGIKLDLGLRDVPQIGLEIALVTDPIGTRIELTEGFADK
jgi:hypothetical protein